MRDKLQPALRILCLVLGAILLLEIVAILARKDPLKGLSIPQVPVLKAEAEVQASNAGITKEAQRSGAGTAAPIPPSKASREINAPNAALRPAGRTSATNTLAATREASPTNGSSAAQRPKTAAENNSAQSNPGSNGSPVSAVIVKTDGKNRTNAASQLPGGVFPAPGFGPGSPAKAPELPPDILARVVKVTESEILGPVNHPLPMALLGIAGDVAFLRSPTGQTGMVKEGDTLGSLKLLRIGTNRVLVELDGKKEELTIFSGFGGESLLPK